LRRLQAEVVEAVMQRAYRLHRRVEHDRSPQGLCKRQVAEHMLTRALGKKAKPKAV
jgi:hypothetical protein